MSTRQWKLLLVDDAQDLHAITKLALRNKRWRKRRFDVRSAYSGKEAREMLQRDSDFHVVIVDVVMEEEDSGLRLCEHIRANCDRSMRIILRTGQPGRAPEEHILSEYDIDYYLSKADVTPERLFSTIRACLRSSHDISTLLAYGRQLRSFTNSLESVSSLVDLGLFMSEALVFLELKHSAKTVFSHDLVLNAAQLLPPCGANDLEREEMQARTPAAFAAAHDLVAGLQQGEHKHFPGSELGLDSRTHVLLFEVRAPAAGQEQSLAKGALAFRLDKDLDTTKAIADFVSDASLFLENWAIAFATLRLKERLAREQLLRDRMYHERMESIATMVAGVAHELNTPLGVARTAASVIQELATALRTQPDDVDAETAQENSDGLDESCILLNRNLDRAQRLLRGFKQLSTSQLSDERVTIPLHSVLEDCLETMKPQLKRHKVTTSLSCAEGDDYEWDGFPGHISQVIINLIQNTVRHAYPDNSGGAIDVRLSRREGAFRIEFADYGAGVAPEIFPRLFDAFVTSARGKGGTGLGLAIAQNIVSNLLGGTIACTSELGEGTAFVIDVPTVVKGSRQEAFLSGVRT